MAFPQSGSGVGAEGVDQGLPHALVDSQRLGLPPRGGVRVHQQCGGPLVDGPLVQQPGQLRGGHLDPPQRQLGLGEVRDHLDRHLSQAARHRRRNRGDDRGQSSRTLTPQRRGLGESGAGGLRVTRPQPFATGRGESLEAQRVHVGRVHGEPVTVQHPDNHPAGRIVRAEGTP